MERIFNPRDRARAARVGAYLFAALSGILVTACGSELNGGSASGSQRRILPEASVLGTSADPLTIAVRYVAFQSPDGGAVTSDGPVRDMLGEMSAVWSQCNISFQLDLFEAIEPASVDARYNPANYAELDDMRVRLDTPADLVIVGTGAWNRAGDLGNSGSNCYSSFPGDDAEGIVCEYRVAASPLIMSHEVGHWLNLRHTDDPYSDAVDDTNSGSVGYNLMNHFVAPQNNELTRGQCIRAREAIANSRAGAVLL